MAEPALATGLVFRHAHHDLVGLQSLQTGKIVIRGGDALQDIDPVTLVHALLCQETLYDVCVKKCQDTTFLAGICAG